MIRVAVDVETSGWKPFWNDVITIGIVVYDDSASDFTPIATFYGKARPWTPSTWDEGSTNAHKFFLEDTLEWPDVRTLCIEILHFLKRFYTPNKYLLFVYHAERNFDLRHMMALFIKAELQFSLYKVFSETHTHSTLLEAREKGFTGNTLSLWANRLNRQFVHHNALDDALMCGALDIYLLRNGGQNALESLTQQAPAIHQEGVFQIDGLSPVDRKSGQRRKVQRKNLQD